LEIGQHLAKLWARVQWLVFLTLGVVWCCMMLEKSAMLPAAVITILFVCHLHEAHILVHITK